jgi:membrane protease YdiL (CAAX protease family)
MYMPRKHQILQLLAVCLFAYLPAIIYAVYLLFADTGSNYTSSSAPNYTITIIHIVLALSLLNRVMSVRGISSRDIGVTISIRRIIAGFVLAISAWVLYSIVYITVASLLPAGYADIVNPKNVAFGTNGFSILLLLFLILNPFCEELIVRGFLMTEVFSLTNSKTAAVIISVLFQTSYHLYQGVIPALLTGVVFLLFSLFYIKTGNLTSVIVAHLLLDLAILFY